MDIRPRMGRDWLSAFPSRTIVAMFFKSFRDKVDDWRFRQGEVCADLSHVVLWEDGCFAGERRSMFVSLLFSVAGSSVGLSITGSVFIIASWTKAYADGTAAWDERYTSAGISAAGFANTARALQSSEPKRPEISVGFVWISAATNGESVNRDNIWE